jgi:hypothetical protein
MVLTCAAVAGLAVAARGAHAQAETPVAPVTPAQADPLPFTNAELEQALLARLLTPPDETGALRTTRVEPAEPGAVRVQVGTRSRVVALGERTGAAAARVVALVIAELVSAAPDASASAAAVPAVSPPLVPPPRAAVAPAPPATPSGRSSVPRVCLTGGVAKGVGNEELLAGTLDADLVVPIGRGRLRIAPSVGLVITPTRNAGTFDEISFAGAALRMLGGVAIGPIEVLAGPLLSPYSIGGATPHDGLLLGGEAVARVAAPLAERLWLVAATRADGYATRVRVNWADGRAYGTPRLGLAVDVGLAWSWAS